MISNKRNYVMLLLAVLLSAGAFSISSSRMGSGSSGNGSSNTSITYNIGNTILTPNFTNLYPASRSFDTVYWNNASQTIVLSLSARNMTANLNPINISISINGTEMQRSKIGAAVANNFAQFLYFEIPAYSSFNVSNDATSTGAAYYWYEWNKTYQSAIINTTSNYYNTSYNNYSNISYNNYSNTTGNGYTLFFVAATVNPLDSLRYYFGSMAIAPQVTAMNTNVTVPKAGNITYANIHTWAATVAGSNENIIMNLSINNNVNYTIATVGTATAKRDFINTSLNIPVVQGDNLEFWWNSPVWGTNPTGFLVSGNVYIE